MKACFCRWCAFRSPKCDLTKTCFALVPPLLLQATIAGELPLHKVAYDDGSILWHDLDLQPWRYVKCKFSTRQRVKFLVNGRVQLGAVVLFGTTNGKRSYTIRLPDGSEVGPVTELGLTSAGFSGAMFLFGQRVEANFDACGGYYPGRIVNIHKDGTFSRMRNIHFCKASITDAHDSLSFQVHTTSTMTTAMWRRK